MKLSIISGGISANYHWLENHTNIGKINNIRLGESLFLGVETLYRKSLDGFFQDSFTLVGEVIESKIKPSLPNGEIALNAFGEIPHFEDKGLMHRAIAGIGREDVDINGLIPRIDIDILGGSSDHIILDAKEENLKVGTLIKFDLNYSALLSAMSSECNPQTIYTNPTLS
jgi:predicted amino acid racemase